MTSQIDFDQGGTFRTFDQIYLGPSIGWVAVPGGILPIIAGGTFVISPGVTLITVSTTGAVTIKLPSTISLVPPAGVNPGATIMQNVPITIVDIGGNAQAHPITIQPASGSENIMNLTQIQITVNYGGYVLQPNSTLKGWNSISP